MNAQQMLHSNTITMSLLINLEKIKLFYSSLFPTQVIGSLFALIFHYITLMES